MTRLDADPPGSVAPAPRPHTSEGGPGALVGPTATLLTSREVPLGGIRGMIVHRTLPQRQLPMVGAWCFLDRFGPQTTRMRVEPHPHIGLQTVTWPFIGQVHHRDALGSDVVVRSGVLNLMTSGAGISHSEYSVGDDPVPLDALQLWVALPESRRHGDSAFEQHADLPIVELLAEEGASPVAVVVLGEFAGARSPATAYTPIAGAEIRMPPGARTRLPLRPDWEYALVGVDGTLRVDAVDDSDPVVVAPQEMLYLGAQRAHIDIASELGTSLFLIGGEPFEDDIVMWWNFVGRTHEEIVLARDDWEAADARFGRVEGHGDVRVPAPPLPAVRLTPRRRRA